MVHGSYGGDQGIARRLTMAPVMLLLRGRLGALLVVLRRRGGSGRAIGQMEVPHPDAERLPGERFADGEIDEAGYGARRPAQRRT